MVASLMCIHLVYLTELFNALPSQPQALLHSSQLYRVFNG